MGQFSWYTQDTNHRIVNGEKFKVFLSDDKGNHYLEECYEGYGEFGGKDYYVLMAEMNGYSLDYENGAYYLKKNGEYVYDKLKQRAHNPIRYKMEDMMRGIGIGMAFDESPSGQSIKWLHPSITEYGKYMDGVAPYPDPEQGFSNEEWED